MPPLAPRCPTRLRTAGHAQFASWFVARHASIHTLSLQ